MEPNNTSQTTGTIHPVVEINRMKVSANIIELCIKKIDSPIKRQLRKILIPIKKLQLGILHIGKGFQWGTDIRFHKNTTIGDYVYIGRGFDSASPVDIGDLVLISTECKIIGNDHNFSCIGIPTRLNFSYSEAKTIIEADAWIGKRVTIKQGIRIGAGSVIGSGSVVLKDVPPYTVYAGVPARKIKDRFSPSEIQKHESVILYHE